MAHGNSLAAATVADAALTKSSEAPQLLTSQGCSRRPLAAAAAADAALTTSYEAPHFLTSKGASRRRWWLRPRLPRPRMERRRLVCRRCTPGRHHGWPPPLTATMAWTLGPHPSVFCWNEGEGSPFTRRRRWTERRISPPIAGGLTSSDLCPAG
ncbi:UNVERIFIED_CONTAM: hypothetical protein Sradi_7169800 [Sesamum radiatum]|uniref:Uncharacterized protein n=1 Tax=Sesamum radiatum TaxID=300843 RepID=A0AAW2IT17_SESRA